MAEVIDFQKYKESGELPEPEPPMTRIYGVIVPPGDKKGYVIMVTSKDKLELAPLTEAPTNFVHHFEESTESEPLVVFLDTLPFVEAVEVYDD